MTYIHNRTTYIRHTFQALKKIATGIKIDFFNVNKETTNDLFCLYESKQFFTQQSFNITIDGDHLCNGGFF